MKLITITLILLVVLFLFLFSAKKEGFNIIKTIEDDERIIPYKLRLNLNTPLKKYRFAQFSRDADGNLIDKNITGCDEYRQHLYKYKEPLGELENPKEYKDKKGNNCQYYKENPDQCSKSNSALNSLEVTKIGGWFTTYKYKDSPRDACYVKESETQTILKR